MISNNYLSAFLLICFFSQFSFGQKYSVHKKKHSYIEAIGGINFSIPFIADRYAVLTTVGSNYNEDYLKEYGKINKNLGMQFGIRYSYNFTNSISVISGFGYQTQTFHYMSHYSWINTLENQKFEREMHHNQKVSYFTLPLLARWDMTRSQFMPYVQAGLFFSFRHQAQKEIIFDNTIDGEETEHQISSSGIAPLTDHIRKFNMGLSAGVGINYHTKFATFGIESNFNYGFFKVVNDQERYADHTGFALSYLDVLDQFKLSHINVQLSVSVPINHSVKLNILRRSRYYK